MPLISVIIPARGRRSLLEETMASLQSQTLADWEAIVVDDHSPDDTAAWLASAAARDDRIRPLTRVGPVGGANVARNQGVAASQGKYVVFLDSDDLLEPDCLQLRSQFLEADPQLDFTVHAMRCFQTVPNDTDLAWNTLTDEDDFERYLIFDGPWQTVCATWRRTALDRIGPWDPAVLSLQDLDFHIRSLTVGLRYRKINAWDCHYRLPHNRDTITHDNRSLAHYQSHTIIARRLLDLPDEILTETANRKAMLAGFCYLVAVRCATKGDQRTAIKLWWHALRKRIVGPRRFIEGAAIMIASKRPAMAAQLKRSILPRWPSAWRIEFRRTFLNAPLPPRAVPTPEQGVIA